MWSMRQRCFRRWRQDDLTTLTKRLLHCPESVGKLGPPYQSYQMQRCRYWAGSYTSTFICHWKGRTIPRRPQTMLKTLGFLCTLHPLQTGLQSNAASVLFAEPCCPRRLIRENPVVEDETSKGLPPTAIWGTTMSAGCALSNQTSFCRGLDLYPSLFFIQPVQPGLRGPSRPVKSLHYHHRVFFSGD